MMPKSGLRLLAIQTVLIFMLSLTAAEIEARKGGGGRRGGGGRSVSRSGGFKKGGAASRGSFKRGKSSRRSSFSARGPAKGGSFGRKRAPSARRPSGAPQRPPAYAGKPGRPPAGRPPAGRPGGRPPVHHQRHYDWDDNWGWGRGFAAGAITALTVGAILSATAFANQSCTPTSVIVGGVTYYQCGPNWYTRAYQGGDVNYVVVDPPPGY